MRLLLLVLAATLVAAAPARAAEPTAAHPIVVGEHAVSRAAIEREGRRLVTVLVDMGIARQQAASGLTAQAWRRAEARRRGLRSHGQAAVAAAVAGGARDSAAFARRFEAFDARWRAATKCTRGWARAVPACAPRPSLRHCLWSGAAELCRNDLDPPEKPFWDITAMPEHFGLPETGGELHDIITRRVRRLPAPIRREIGDILLEGSVTAYTETRRAAWAVAREVHLAYQSRRR